MRYLVMRPAAVAMCVSLLSACGGPRTQGTNTSAGEFAVNATAALLGAGSTFAFPLYSKWVDAYKHQTGVSIAYESTGSGDGIRRFSNQTIDFGATDGPMTDSELAHAKGGPVLHIPTALGADIVAYNLPTVTVPLRFTPDVLADIFLGKITKWSDPRLAQANPNAKLPATDILVVHRVDGSGTTYVWTDYLSTVSDAWAHGPGRGKEIAWPAGVAARGNDGVAGMVKQTPGAIGYIELTYAKEMGLPAGLVRNAAGAYVAPSVASISAAAAGVATHLPANTDYRISVVNPPGPDAYPIASFTWILVYRNQSDSAKGTRLVKFLRWALGDGQALEEPLSYAPLPEALLSALRLRLDSIRLSGASRTVAVER